MNRAVGYLVLWASVFVLPSSFAIAAEDSPTERHLLYVAAPGIRNDLSFGGAGLLVFDIDNNHHFLRRIATRASLEAKPENIKGIAGTAVTGRLYFTTLTRLYAFDLHTEHDLWEKSLSGGCDRLTISPDGKTLYVPSLEGAHWNIVDAQNGEVLAKVEPNSGSHNTVCSQDGRFVYCAGLRSPLLTVVDTSTNTITGTIGPFTASVRPFTVNADRSQVFVNVNALLGFEVADARSGKLLHRVEVPGFKQGTVARHGCPSHGIGLTPDGREVWVADAANRRVHLFDSTKLPPTYLESIELRDEPGWITFSINGRYAYPSTGDIIDTRTRKIVAALEDEEGRYVASEKMLEIDFRGKAVVQVGDQFGVGRNAHAVERPLPAQ